MATITEQAQELGEFLMIPNGNAGRIVQNSLDAAAEAEAAGDLALAQQLLEYALLVDSSR